MGVMTDVALEPVISVIVCVYNDPTAVKCLRDQEGAPPYEIIIVDDGSRPAIADAVAPLLVDTSGQLIVHDQNRGISAARNSGLMAARGSIVSFTDADCRPGPDWVASISRAWRQAPDGTVAVAGVVTAADEDSLARRYASATEPLRALEIELKDGATLADRIRVYLSILGKREGVRPVASPVGANMSFKKETLLAIGGFDPSVTFGGDEYPVSRALIEAFGTDAILLDPSVTTQHDFDPSFRDSLRRAHSYGLGAGRAFSSNGGHLEIRPVGTLVAVAGVVAVATRSRRAAVGFIFLVILLPLLVWRRVFRQVGRFGPEVAIYPSMALIEEILTMWGFISGWLEESMTSTQASGAH
jgi:Glycosyl transferase family 2